MYWWFYHHIVCVIFFDKFINVLPKPNFETIRALNYTLWVGLSFYHLLFSIPSLSIGIASEESFELAVDDMKNTILSVCVVYLYEMAFHPPDFAHKLHHWLSIVLQLFGLYIMDLSDDYRNYVLVIGYLNHVGMVSSIWSSLRWVVRDNCVEYFDFTKRIYKGSYVLAKVLSVLWQYYFFFSYEPEELIAWIHVVGFVVASSVQVVQLYFCYKIVC